VEGFDIWVNLLLSAPSFGCERVVVSYRPAFQGLIWGLHQV